MPQKKRRHLVTVNARRKDHAKACANLRDEEVLTDIVASEGDCNMQKECLTQKIIPKLAAKLNKWTKAAMLVGRYPAPLAVAATPTVTAARRTCI